MNDLRTSLNTWVCSTLANRADIKPVADTTGFVGTIKGLPSILASGESEAAVLGSLDALITAYAEKTIASGKALPIWEVPAPEVSADAWSLVRVTTLRKLLKKRAGEWGALRQQLPTHAVERCLAEIDIVVTRHAVQMQGATPPDEASLK